MNRLFNLLFSISLIFFWGVCGASCTRKTPNNSGTETEIDAIAKDSIVIESSKQIIPKTTQTLHVFIENSGSMNGYINATSDFQMAIGRTIQLMKFKYGEGNIKTYYINTKVSEKIRPNNTDIYAFVQQMLERQNFSSTGGTSSTDLNNIIKEVLNFVDENNSAILISDFIYSLPSTNGVTTNLLYGCQNLTMSAFLEKTKEMNNISLATNLVQLFSSFQGHYWHWEKPNGSNYVNLNCQRPYYICIMGTDDNVKDFNKSINIESLKGYKNQFTISNKNMANTSYTVFDTKYKKGKYRHNNTDAIHYINKVGKTTNDEFELGIGIDLSDFTMSESDKLDIANYTINQGNYQILKIEPIDTLKLANPTDKNLVRKNNCTHAIVLACTGFPNDISLSIKRELPSWVNNSSSIDDRNIAFDETEQNKTFGFYYFVEGISDAYNYLATDKNNFMTINIKVSTNN